MQISETLTVSYEDAEHKRYADLLMRYGFVFQVEAPSMRVGLVFIHPVKNHRVYLERGEDGSLEPKLSIFHGRSTDYPSRNDFDVPMHPLHYSDFEWRALQQDDPDDFTVLERELHIWFKVRPHSLHTQLRLD